jgi:2-dehydropantoate 2-reductase
VVLAATGETHVGIDPSVVEPAPWFTDSLSRLPDWHWEAAVDARVAHKFAINCIINPLTALLGCRNGDLLPPGGARQELLALCEETEPALVDLGLWPAQDSLLDAVSTVCRATAANRSSMLQDRTAGRTTEIDFLTGELLRRTASTGHALPRNETLYARLTARA